MKGSPKSSDATARRKRLRHFVLMSLGLAAVTFWLAVSEACPLQKMALNKELALAASGNRDTSPYLSLTLTVDLKEENPEEFRSLLGRVLAFDPDPAMNNRLVNILCQRKAQRLLHHLDEFFLLDENDRARATERQSG